MTVQLCDERRHAWAGRDALQRGLPERAKKYREAASKAVSYDLDYYFKQVDVNPSLYQRQ